MPVLDDDDTPSPTEQPVQVETMDVNVPEVIDPSKFKILMQKRMETVDEEYAYFLRQKDPFGLAPYKKIQENDVEKTCRQQEVPAVEDQKKLWLWKLLLLLFGIPWQFEQEFISSLAFLLLVLVVYVYYSPKHCGHGDKKTAHGRSSNSSACRGESVDTCGGSLQRGLSVSGGGGGDGDGIGDGSGHRDSHTDDSPDNAEVNLQHGEFDDVLDAIEVVIHGEQESLGILQQMDRCLDCCLRACHQNCPTRFCSRLLSSIQHYCSQDAGCGGFRDCGICALVFYVVAYHLQSQEESEDGAHALPHLIGSEGKDSDVRKFLRDHAAELPDVIVTPPDFGKASHDHRLDKMSKIARIRRKSQPQLPEMAAAFNRPCLDKFLDEAGASTGALRMDTLRIVDKFYQDDAVEKPPLQAAFEPSSLPARLDALEKKPIESGPVQFGSGEDLQKFVQDCDNQKESGSDELDSGGVALGVILKGPTANDHVVSVDGHYDVNVHWTVQRTVGEGSYGTVSLCQDVTTEALFCAKQVEIEKFNSGEVMILSKLQHEGICPLRGALRIDGTVIILMSFIGETLREYLGHQRLPPLAECLSTRLHLADALKMLRGLLQGLELLQQNRVIHNDLKSDNILMDEEGKPVMIDFGLAEEIPSDEEGVRHAKPIGTELTRSPEKCRSELYSCNSDVWAIMGVFREVLTGHLMWFPKYRQAPTLIFLIGACRSPPVSLIPKSLQLPSEVMELFEKGWVPNSNRTDAGSLLREVETVIQGLELGQIMYEVPQIQSVDEEEILDDDTDSDEEYSPQESPSTGSLMKVEDPLGASDANQSFEINIKEIPIAVPNFRETLEAHPTSSDPEQMVLTVNSVSSQCQHSVSSGSENIPRFSLLMMPSIDATAAPQTDGRPHCPPASKTSDLGDSLAVNSSNLTGNMSSIEELPKITDNLKSSDTITDGSGSDQTLNAESILYSRRSSLASTTPSPTTPRDISMRSAERTGATKGSESSSDEVLDAFRQGLEEDAFARQMSSGKSFDPLNSVQESVLASPPTEYNPQTWSDLESTTSGALREILFHSESQSGEVLARVTVQNSRQRMRDIIETASTKVHRTYPLFTVLDQEGNRISQSAMAGDVVRTNTTNTVSLIVQPVGENYQDGWYCVNHEVITQ